MAMVTTPVCGDVIARSLFRAVSTE